MPRSPVVYDKAKYHDASVSEAGLPSVQAEVHTAFFLGWILDHDLYSEAFAEDSKELIAQYKAGEIDALKVYESEACCLDDDMLNDEGNAFAQYYFDFNRGRYLDDYGELLAGDLPTMYHVRFTPENRVILDKRIDERFTEWRQHDRPTKTPWWKFW
jgi:hypothetical protein